MNWKHYRQKLNEMKNGGSPASKADESFFILGVDLGDQSSSIAFFNVGRNTPETIDISGGYGKPGMPTAMQYAKEGREWVFGEYALLNRGQTTDSLYLSLLEKLPRREYLDVDGKPQSIESVMGVYVKELIQNCKNINPRAEIAGITLAVPSYTSDETKEALAAVFKAAGYEKALIEMVPDRECVFSHYFHKREIKAETVVLLDFGSRELRGGIYGITPGTGAEKTKITSLSSMIEKKCGAAVMDKAITGMLADFFAAETKIPAKSLDIRITEQLHSFAYQHKDILLQKNIGRKPVKLYFNFAYPPVVCAVDDKTMERLIKPFVIDFNGFLKRLFSKSLYSSGGGKPVLNASGINTVICTGGGFEMLWARTLVEDFFSGSEVLFSKNSKGIIAEGACIRSAAALSAIPEKPFAVEDRHKLDADIGVRISKDKKERFYPIIERNSFWWQDHEPVSFIFSEETRSESSIQLLCRNSHGEVKRLGDIPLGGLPPRPAGTTRLDLWLEFSAYNILTATVRDMGFGEMFPASDFNRKAEFTLA